jgi:uncharacterized protein
MEITAEFIQSLAIDDRALTVKTAQETGVAPGQAAAVIGMLAEGSTVPFIARYRKERTGSLDEVQVRDIDRRFTSLKNLETRRHEIIRGIFDQGKLTPALYDNICRACTGVELEDIYAPYKRKKKTRGMLAIERGLEPLADAMEVMETAPLMAFAEEFVKGLGSREQGTGNREEEGNREQGTGNREFDAKVSETTGQSSGSKTDSLTEIPVPGPRSPVPQSEPPLPTPASLPLTLTEALSGAQDIIAERAAQTTENRGLVKSIFLGSGKIEVKGVGDDEAKKTSTYLMYWDYSEPLSQIKPHRILAINRGEREGALEITINVDVDAAVLAVQGRYAIHNEHHRLAIEDGVRRLLSPAVIRELRGDQEEAADEHGISVFSENLRNLLMQKPIKGARVLGIDPGIRTGTKCACMDDTGKYLGNFVISNFRVEEAKALILRAIKDYRIELIAVGNGTGTREVQEIVTQVIAENGLNVLYTVVDEDGASVYSASDIAREEFPSLDLTIRGAISIGRRLQDPLAELVKIDPKSIGVGLYQHDVNQKKLSETLDDVVSSVVNNVGVNLNTASVSLLKYVSGINSGLARKIVQYREEKGRIASRQELTAVPGMGEKTFEQCAGFLKIPESAEPLDNTWVHPENYPAAREIRAVLQSASGNSAASGISAALSATVTSGIAEKYGIGGATIHDILEELRRPGRDPREDYPAPIMQKGVVTFEDLAEGMKVLGKIKNVVDFGAFVDLGIKETALVHISELSDRYIKDPMEVVKVGDILDFTIIGLDRDRRRISLSRKNKEKRSADSTDLHGLSKERNAEKPGLPVKPLVRVRTGGQNLTGGRKLNESRQKTDGQNVTAGQKSTEGQKLNAGQFSTRGQPGAAPRTGARPGPGRDDDGTMYSPFAEALRKMKEK